MKYISRILLIFVVIITSSCKEDKVEHAKDKPMNILFLSMDDLKPMLGAYGDDFVISPNIDKLASEGVTFDNAYAQQAVCAVSRVSLFCGQSPDRTKVWDLKTQMRDVKPNALTIPQYFKQNGYITVGRGKLLHGQVDSDQISWTIPYIYPDRMKYAKGFLAPVQDRYQNPEIHKLYKEAKAKKLNWGEINRYFKSKNLALSTENLDIPDNAYVDGATADAGIVFLDSLSKLDKPFFLALGFKKPHLPFVAPKKYWDMYNREDMKIAPYQEHAKDTPELAYKLPGEIHGYSDIPKKEPIPLEKQKELIHGYHACVSYVDAQVGRVIDHLKELGLEKNTLIVLWGDHGWHLGDHGLWTKHSNFEQATRVPLIISAPGVKKGVHAKTMAELIDLFPTLVDYAGLEMPNNIEGKSLVPVLKDNNVIVKDFAISQFPRGDNDDIMGYSMRTKRYRITLWLKGEYRKNAIYENPEIVGIELYDYENDPLEKVSLANNTEHKELTNRLKTKLLSLLRKQKKEYGY
ncbi:MAG: sulfatase [Flavobacteriales bacterium]|nr:sulfatase [Flavobacteriales bacterium]